MSSPLPAATTAQTLAEWVRDARERTFETVADLSDADLLGPRLAIVNPLLWEIGHVAWFQEKWVLRHTWKRPPIRPDGDALYDSASIPHDVRWDLPLPSREETLEYMRAVRDAILERLDRREPTEEEAYFVRLSVFHEDMHDEAFLYTRQTHGYPAPHLTHSPGFARAASARGGGALPGDAEVAGGPFRLGAEREDPFVFDNEKWAHPVEVRPFRIARAPVTQGEFAAFVEEGGYGRRDLWSEEGWRWREQAAAEHPVYWRRGGRGEWTRRHFDRWAPLEANLPVVHVSAHEAEAYCAFAGRRLPTEAEWEMASASKPGRDGRLLEGRKRRFPWGEDDPQPAHANLDGLGGGCVEVGALEAGDSAFGCRQMTGNVWEWTSTAFGPYPGFIPDPYKEYSQPWFGDHRVLRGGGWPTRGRMLRNTWRNFYKPDRRDVWAGFRTCAREA